MTKMNEDIKKLLLSDDIFPENQIQIKGRPYYLDEPKNSGEKGVIWKGSNKYGVEVAIKFKIYDDYINRSYIKEATRAGKLLIYENFACYGGCYCIYFITGLF